MKKLSGWKRLWIICSLCIFIPVAIFLYHNISVEIDKYDYLYLSETKIALPMVSSEAIKIKHFAEAAVECKQQPVSMMIYGYTKALHIPKSKIVEQIKKDCEGKINIEEIAKKADKEALSQSVHNVFFYSKYLLGSLLASIAITGVLIGIVRWIILGFSHTKQI